MTTVGVMAEVPSLAVLADQVAAVTDFVSIGTNDLTQYTLAADRMLGSVAAYQDPWHPAVLRLVKLLGDAGAAAGKPVGVCGEAAADPKLAVVLVGLGCDDAVDDACGARGCPRRARHRHARGGPRQGRGRARRDDGRRSTRRRKLSPSVGPPHGGLARYIDEASYSGRLCTRMRGRSTT